MSEVINLNERKDSMKPHFSVIALCLPCQFRWIGLVIPDTSLFALECPRCKKQDSFASFIAQEYMDEFKGPVTS